MMLPLLATLPLLSVLDDAVNLFTYGWWIWLAILAFYFYRWAQEHLPFSPILTLVVAGLLIYFLVIEHPIIGTIGVVGWMVISSSLLFVLPLALPFFKLGMGGKAQAGGPRMPGVRE